MRVDSGVETLTVSRGSILDDLFLFIRLYVCVIFSFWVVICSFDFQCSWFPTQKVLVTEIHCFCCKRLKICKYSLPFVRYSRLLKCKLLLLPVEESVIRLPERDQ